MTTTFRKIRIVIFLAAIVGIGLFLTWMLGAKTALRQKITVVTEFSESVNGLVAGSPVRYHGVVVGRIRHIAIQETRAGDRVRIFMDLDAASLGCENAQQARQMILNKLKPDEHGRVLAASQVFASMATGQKAILFEPTSEIDVPANQVILDNGKYVAVPSHKSMMTQATDLAVHLMEQLKDVDVRQIGVNLQQALAKADRLLGDPRLDQTLGNASAASASARDVGGKLQEILDVKTVEALKRMLANASQASDDLAAVTADMRRMQNNPQMQKALADFQVLPAKFNALADSLEAQTHSANLPATSTELRNAAQNVSGAAQSIAATSRDISETRTAVLRTAVELEQTLRELRELLARINNATAAPPAKE